MNAQLVSRIWRNLGRLAFLLLLTPFLIACDTQEVGIERTATPTQVALTTMTTEGTRPTATPWTTPTNTPTIQAEGGVTSSYQANGHSGSPAISAEGWWIAVQSLADNLVAGDTNGYMDVFLFDCETGTIELVSWAVGS